LLLKTNVTATVAGTPVAPVAGMLEERVGAADNCVVFAIRHVARTMRANFKRVIIIFLSSAT
jgi:hypothetical protein